MSDGRDRSTHDGIASWQTVPHVHFHQFHVLRGAEVAPWGRFPEGRTTPILYEPFSVRPQLVAHHDSRVWSSPGQERWRLT